MNIFLSWKKPNFFVRFRDYENYMHPIALNFVQEAPLQYDVFHPKDVEMMDRTCHKSFSFKTLSKELNL